MEEVVENTKYLLITYSQLEITGVDRNTEKKKKQMIFAPGKLANLAEYDDKEFAGDIFRQLMELLRMPQNQAQF